MSAYADAVAALQQAFKTAWSGPAVSFQNEAPQGVWPPLSNGKPLPWLYLEIVASMSEQRGAGSPGDQTWLTRGSIFCHVFVPVNTGIADAMGWADDAGRVFRGKTFAANADGRKVVCQAHVVDGGDSAADNGNYFCVTAIVPFEFYDRG